MKEKFKRLFALMMTLAIVMSMAAPVASAAAITRYNASYSPVSCNASAGNLPSGVSTVYTNETIYFNFQVDNSQKLKSVTCQVIPVGSSGSGKQATETASNFMRYTSFDWNTGNQAGTLKYRFTVRYTSGSQKTYGWFNITVKKPSIPTDKINKFINDNRWKNGISWGYYQKPKISTYGSIGCCAYAADFVKYVYGSNNLRSGTKYTKASAIKTGDVLYGTPQHWMCVVSRSGNTLKIAQGNCSSKVRIATYTLSGNKIKTSNGSVFKTFSYGYHYY